MTSVASILLFTPRRCWRNGMPVPDIPAVMNGEECPGCRTSIWGARPKHCFMCGYDFENPKEEDLLENRARREADQISNLDAAMNRQRVRGAEIEAKIRQMTEEFLQHEDFPKDASP